MLLIAQPKAASTSLLYSLAEIMKVAPVNGRNRKQVDVPCPGYEELQKYHGTTVQRSNKYLLGFINTQTVLYKEHILPIKNHLDIMKECKNIVVLLREPKETIESYKRVFSVLSGVKVDYNKLLDEVTEFYEVYNSDDNYLKVFYNDVVNNFHETVKKILDCYGFDIPANLNEYELAKKNYNRWGQ